MTADTAMKIAALALLVGAGACAADPRIAQLEASVARLEAAVAAQDAKPADDAPDAAPPAPRKPPPSDTFAGWIINGSNVDGFSIVHDLDVKQAGAASARIECVVPDPKGFGGMMQSIAADSYRGKRVRFSALVRTRDAVGWVGLWMRVDRPNERASAFDNMQNRSIKGTTDWQRYDVVLDVAPDAESVHYGLLLANGAGTAWLDDAAVDIVDPSVATTNMTPSTPTGAPSRPTAPANLSLDN